MALLDGELDLESVSSGANAATPIADLGCDVATVNAPDASHVATMAASSSGTGAGTLDASHVATMAASASGTGAGTPDASSVATMAACTSGLVAGDMEIDSAVDTISSDEEEGQLDTEMLALFDSGEAEALSTEGRSNSALLDEYATLDATSNEQTLGNWFVNRWCRGKLSAAEMARGAKTACRRGDHADDGLLRRLARLDPHHAHRDLLRFFRRGMAVPHVVSCPHPTLGLIQQLRGRDEGAFLAAP